MRKVEDLFILFSSVVRLDIPLCESKYVRSLDRLVIPLKDCDELYYAVAHELGHKNNSKILLFLFDFCPIRLFQLLLEIDAHLRALLFVRECAYISFAWRYLKLYLKN